MIENPGIKNLVVPIGRDFCRRFTIKDRVLEDDTFVDTPRNLLNYTFKSEIRSSTKPTSSLISEFTVLVADNLRLEYTVARDGGFSGTESEWLTSTGYPELYDPAVDTIGVIWLYLSDTDTKDIEVSKGYYDLLITNAIDQDDTYMSGLVTFTPFPTVK